MKNIILIFFGIVFLIFVFNHFFYEKTFIFDNNEYYIDESDLGVSVLSSRSNRVAFIIQKAFEINENSFIVEAINTSIHSTCGLRLNIDSAILYPTSLEINVPVKRVKLEYLLNKVK